MKRYAIILAGGMGNRLWPLSRKDMPKQLLKVDGKVMLERTIERLEKLFEKENIFIITRKELKEKIINNIGDVILSDNIIVEKETRGTAYAVAIGIEKVSKKNKDAVVSIFPSDAYIENEIEYIETVKKAIYKADKEKKIIVIGIKPEYPSSGMGYIQCEEITEDDGKVDKFIEKPCSEKAELLLKEKKCFWNAGIVVSTIQTLKTEFLKFAPQFLSEKCYEKGSFDKLILEKTSNIAMVIGRFKWQDIGTFETFNMNFQRDFNGNVICNGAVYIDSKNVLCISQEKRIIAFGVKDLIIVDTPDVILVMDSIKNQEMETVIRYLEKNKLSDLL